jgi:thioredoxin-like negative regulator of GroEL
MALLVALRPEEALLEALDALARARESKSRNAIGACKALLAKVYAVAGEGRRASALLEVDG